VPSEILAYIGAAVMVVLAFVAYRYFRSTATYARRMRESHAHQVMGPLLASPPTRLVPDEFAPEPAETAQDPASEGDDGPVGASGEEVVEGASRAPDAVDSSESKAIEPGPNNDPVPDVIEDETSSAQGSEPAMDEPSQDHPATAAEDTDVPPIAALIEEAPAANGPESVIGELAEEPVVETTPEVIDMPPAKPPEPTPDQPIEEPADTTPEITTSEPQEEETSATDDPEPTPAEPDDEPAALGAGSIEKPSDDEAQEPVTASLQANLEETLEKSLLTAEYRLIEELEPRGSSPPADPGSIVALLKELDEQLAALPSGIELIDLPILERRRVADRREELLSDQARLLAQKKRGAHRRRRGFPSTR